MTQFNVEKGLTRKHWSAVYPDCLLHIQRSSEGHHRNHLKGVAVYSVVCAHNPPSCPTQRCPRQRVWSEWKFFVIGISCWPPDKPAALHTTILQLICHVDCRNTYQLHITTIQDHGVHHTWWCAKYQLWPPLCAVCSKRGHPTFNIRKVQTWHHWKLQIYNLKCFVALHIWSLRVDIWETSTLNFVFLA